MIVDVFVATVANREDVVKLFSENDNPHGWDSQRWNHYYLDYPEGESVSIVAKYDGKVVGHYGLLPIKIGEYNGFLGVHAYVSADMRGLTVISALMKYVDTVCEQKNVDILCGFANKNFTLVKQQLYKWYVVCWMGFSKRRNFIETSFSSRKFRFNYSDSWYKWRFGEEKDTYFSLYTQRNEGGVLQLLKTRKDIVSENGVDLFECWHPSEYFQEKQSHFTQPFSMKLFGSNINKNEILDLDNWYLEMGDSDTFVYKSR